MKRKTFAQKLRSLIDDNQTTAYRLSLDSGVSEQAISHYLRGDREPGLQQLVKLARALGVSLSEFDAVKERKEQEVEVTNA